MEADGVLLIDKPSGCTSHDVVDYVRNRFHFKKVGHCGTLDPLATGLLLLTLGRGTKIQDLLSDQLFAVVPQVEKIESSKMPTIAQVRYFNKDDEAVADKAVAALRQVYTNASKLYVGLKAPKGQLEIWLPRAGESPSAAALRRAEMMASRRVNQ